MGLYGACLSDIRENGPKALASVLTFLMIPDEMFYPPFDASEALGEVERVAAHDAHAYYGLLLALDCKVNVLLAYTNVDRASCCEDLWCSLYGLIGRFETWQCKDDALRDAIASEAFRCIGRARGAATMLIAPKIIPKPVNPAATIDGRLAFELVTSDILFHLARTGSAGAYLTSGYADRSLFSADTIHTLDSMLGCYTERIRQCMQVCS